MKLDAAREPGKFTYSVFLGEVICVLREGQARRKDSLPEAV